jgi:hypothetical protein
MTAPAKISLAQQIEALDFALTRQRNLARGGSIKGLRGRSAEEYDCERLAASIRTMEWLSAHERDIRAFIALTPEARRAALAMAQAGARPDGLPA